MFKLKEREKDILKTNGLQDSDILMIEQAGLSIVKRNLIIGSCFAIISFLTGFLILGKIF